MRVEKEYRVHPWQANGNIGVRELGFQRHMGQYQQTHPRNHRIRLNLEIVR